MSKQQMHTHEAWSSCIDSHCQWTIHFQSVYKC